MMTKEQILAHKAWTPEEIAKIENCFKVAGNFKKSCTLSQCTPDTIVAEVAKKMQQKAQKGSKKGTITRESRASINAMLKKAKELGFKDEEIAGAIKAMIRQKQVEEMNAKLAAIDAM